MTHSKFFQSRRTLSLVSVLGAALLARLFLGIINGPRFYNSARQLEFYTGGLVLKALHIDHFMVRNSFGLDGPDYYYELSVAPTDRKRLHDFFHADGHPAFNRNADELVPSDWKNGSRSIERYCLLPSNRSAVMLLAMDSQSDKAWLVIYNV